MIEFGLRTLENDDVLAFQGVSVETRITAIGETIGYREWGDSKHFEVRKK